MIYLASPYSHSDPVMRHARFDRICRIAARLMKQGHHVFSPIAHTHPIAMAGDLPTGWDYWQEYDRQILAACSELWICTMNGWRHSNGVKGEILLFKGRPKLLDPNTLGLTESGDLCSKCGSPNTYLQREGMTGQLGTIKCSDCHSEIREWEAY